MERNIVMSRQSLRPPESRLVGKRLILSRPAKGMAIAAPSRGLFGFALDGRAGVQ
jgi:hypothetical protein